MAHSTPTVTTAWQMAAHRGRDCPGKAVPARPAHPKQPAYCSSSHLSTAFSKYVQSMVDVVALLQGAPSTAAGGMPPAAPSSLKVYAFVAAPCVHTMPQCKRKIQIPGPPCMHGG